MSRQFGLILVLILGLSIAAGTFLFSGSRGLQAGAPPSPTAQVAQVQPTAVPDLPEVTEEPATLTPTTAVVPTPTTAVEPTPTQPLPEPTKKVASKPVRSTQKDPTPTSPPPTATKAPPTPTKAPPTPTPEADLALPVRFTIATPDVQVNATVEHVGQTPDGAMDVPKNWMNVAWYQKEKWGGTVPGAPGNAVIAGHLDSTTGPAVFWDLEKLKEGDEVAVIDEKGKTTRFRVVKKAIYYDDNAPLLEIFGPTDKVRLNLITCDGKWDPVRKRYDRRLVVFTEKIG